MSVLIQINGETAGEALKELAALAGPLSGGQAAAEAPKPEKQPRAPRTTAPKSEPEKEQPKPEPEETPGDVPEEESEDVGDEPIPTDVELREAASKVGKRLREAGKDHKSIIRSLLGKYGVQNVTAVPSAKRIVFKRELEALA